MQLHHVSDYNLSHLASHLHAARRFEQLHRLLTVSRDWIEAKLTRLGSTMACAEDLELAMGEFEDPVSYEGLVRLAELYMVLQQLKQRVGLYSDSDLETLIWLGRREEALGYARMRQSSHLQYESLMAIFRTETRRSQPPQELVEELLETARQIPDLNERGKALGEMATILAERREFVEARATARKIEDPGWRGIAEGALAEYLIESNQIEAARSLLEVLSHRIPEIRDPLKRLGVRSQVLFLIARLEIAEDVSGVVQQCFRDVEELGNAMEQIPGWLPLFQNLGRAGYHRHAELTFEKMRAKMKEISIEAMKVFMLAKTVKHLADWGELDKAQLIAEDIEWLPIRATAEITVAEALASFGGRLMQAEEILSHHLTKIGDLPLQSDQDLVMAKLAPVLVKVGRRRQGLQLVDRIADVTRRAGAFIEIARALAARGDEETASGFFESARELLGALDGGRNRIKALTQIAVGLHKSGDKTIAMRILGQASDLYLRTSKADQTDSRREADCKSIIESWITVGEKGKAEDFASMLKGLEGRLAHGALLSFLVRDGRFSEARELVGTCQDLRPSETWSEAAGPLIMALVDGGDLEEASSLVREMDKFYQITAPILKSISGAAVRSVQRMEILLASLYAKLAAANPKATNEAKAHFEQAERTVADIPEPLHQIKALIGLATASPDCESSYLHSHSNRLFVAAQNLVEHCVGRDQDQARASLALARLNVGQMNEATALLGAIQDTMCRSEVQAAIAVFMIEQRDPEAAVGMIEDLEDDKSRSRVLPDLATSLFEAGQAVRAFQILSPLQQDEFLGVVAGWVIHAGCELIPGPQSSATASLQRIVRIAARHSMAWQGTYDILTSEASGVRSR